MSDLKKHVEELFKFSRELTGPGFNQALDYIGKHIPLGIHQWEPGEKIWTWVVPDNGLRIGEYTTNGGTDGTIILPIHLDHPRMANDNLSGVVVAMELINQLQDYNLRHTYKFLFLPETIGTMAWLSRFGTSYKYGIVVDSVGTSGELVSTFTKTPSILNNYLSGKVNTFLSEDHLMTGNDERALESVGIPSIHLTRAPFNEYHSELDTPDIVKEEQLVDTVKYMVSLIKRIELDYIPKPRYEGVPCLSAMGLWCKEYEVPENFIKIERIWHLLTYDLSISEIAIQTRLPFDYVYNFVEKLRDKGIIWSGKT